MPPVKLHRGGDPNAQAPFPLANCLDSEDLSMPKTGLREEKDSPRDLMLPLRQPASRASCYRGVSHHLGRPRRNSDRNSLVESRGLRVGRDSESSEGNASSSRSPFVAVMEPSHFRDLDHRSKFRRLNRSRFRRIFTLRQMRARMQIVSEIRVESPPQAGLIQDNDVVQALPPDGAN